MPAGAGAGSSIIVPPRGKCAEEVLWSIVTESRDTATEWRLLVEENLQKYISMCMLGSSLFGKTKNIFTDIKSWAWFTILEPMHLDFLVHDVPKVALSSPILG